MKTIILVVLLGVVSAKNFDSNGISTCTNFDTTTQKCKKWDQNGVIAQQIPACFPAYAQVMTPFGLKSFKDIKIGDEILGHKDGQDAFGTVTSWLHHDPEVEALYLAIQFGSSSLTVSHKHNLALKSGQFAFAQDTTSEFLFGTVSIFGERTEVKSRGMYAPWTTYHNYFVYSSEQERVLAHDFANIRNPVVYESIVELTKAAWDTFSDTSKDEIHPAFNWLQTHFQFLLD